MYNSGNGMSMCTVPRYHPIQVYFDDEKGLADFKFYGRRNNFWSTQQLLYFVKRILAQPSPLGDGGFTYRSVY